MTDVRTKICGLTRPQDVAAAAEAGAHYLGFNFFPKSPRYVDIPNAGQLALDVPPGIAKVVLVVNPDNALLDAITGGMPLDMIQLHGRESPERVTEIKARYGLPVIKVVGVADASDLAPLETYGRVADQLLVDAKPPKTAELPGGNGLTFDWRLIAGRRWPVPWMLAGGLTPDNVAEAVAMTGATQVDVASGVESGPGIKDAGKMAAFVKAANAGRQAPPKLR
ncbi:phosphoribosylanthranilate isomerase [Marinovum sp.]|uniref:phosphoribosylanthranilate isomerase n=1 Tax=Marinovum sp. TaxID=2024839 RepID=UPI002B267BE3|nr:phosphoribosylanthranilate isomerase [Marinovum sp.]